MQDRLFAHGSVGLPTCNQHVLSSIQNASGTMLQQGGSACCSL
ncbi:hypothetical protein HMPREF0670_01618 [Prevotella sp. oral taxon 317 str. F0108]|nr:hypothetical protein HMPREF0670_01618 [Prevotella sp. oral taxon 317 str. F0108]